VNTRNN
jgi:hypothetical protein